ncbi:MULTISPECIES: hypothetical protein [Metabacillus]|uniref:Uncharacterized protein n=3 Tax=Metabacillus TaxID=2675233 RepID=A0A179SQ52_9BACI|nr:MULTISPECIES: hypothetical protein [Metabacillus]OAS83896.1 hypothetical protein A6K24_07240 [Metabacillus litoralis]QNF28390.1 hypothetical protein HUW50_13445 [Metabacillus sp. KUDC1714]
MEIKVLAVEDGIHNKLKLSREQYAHLKDKNVFSLGDQVYHYGRMDLQTNCLTIYVKPEK